MGFDFRFPSIDYFALNFIDLIQKIVKVLIIHPYPTFTIFHQIEQFISLFNLNYGIRLNIR